MPETRQTSVRFTPETLARADAVAAWLKSADLVGPRKGSGDRSAALICLVETGYALGARRLCELVKRVQRGEAE